MNVNTVDQHDFGALVERHRRELQVHCYRLMGSVGDAEDMVQETFLKAWNGRETLENQAALRAWLYKIATHVCLDALKRRTKRFVPMTRETASTLAEPIPAEIREPIWLEPYPDNLLVSADANPEAYVVARDNITLAFIAALHVLPPRQRAVLILRDVMDWQASEVAALLNTTVSSVKSALHRARSTLRHYDYSHDAVTELALDESLQARLADYVRAWETADIRALIDLLKDDATFSMPPIPSWYRGRNTIGELVARTVFSGQAGGRWCLLATRANGQPAFGLYRQSDVQGVYEAYGIQVLTLRDSQTADITTFRNRALFSYFKLPLILNRVQG